MRHQISTKTMTGEEREKCIAVDGLVINGLGKEGQKVKLPKTYSRKSLPVDIEEVPTPEKVKRWNYLQSNHPYLPKDEDNVEIGLLIGGNCPVALEPVETTSSQHGGPYAFRTSFGWITGPIYSDKSLNTNYRCNQIAVSMINQKNIAGHFFTVPDEVSDNLIKEMLESMYYQDFSELQSVRLDSKSSECLAPSQEDKCFLDLMDKEAQLINGHYQLPLPFRNPGVVFQTIEDRQINGLSG